MKNSQEVCNLDAYRLRVKTSEIEFEFQSPDQKSLLEIGIPLLKSTFGRYKDFEIPKLD